jgi:hypothetical protein
MTSMAALSPGPSRLTSRAAPVSDYYGERSERQAATARYTVYDEDHGDDDETGPVALAPVSVAVSPIPRAPGLPGSSTKPLRIYPFGVSRNRLEQAIGGLNVDVILSKDIADADIVLTLKNYYRKKPPALRQAEAEGLPVYVLKSNTASQMQGILSNIFELAPGSAQAAGGDEDPVTNAIEETEAAITEALETGHPVELPPANAYIRRLQHQMAERYNLGSQSRGREPNRRVRIFRHE